ncbi:MAG TPA: HD domain-containing protein, partial [Puia sp.]|nr:HD domain-containing protein [Puia sp.]
MQFEQLHYFVVSKLKNELPKHLSYHDVQHTLDVIQSAEILAREENVTGEDLTLLLTAALVHDTGYLEAYAGHEEISCSFAKTYLPQYEYTPEQVNRVCEMILATRIPQDPKDLLSKILCDGDLFYLG